MLITGVVLLLAALLTFVTLVPIFRAPAPPRWTRSRFAAEMITLTIVGGLALGLTCLGAGIYRAYQAGPSLIELGVVALTLGLAVVLWRRVGRPEAAPAAPTLVAATETIGKPTPQEPTPPRPVGPTRRAA